MEIKTITRAEAHARTAVWPYGGVPYSQSKRHPGDLYRQDCSGFACMLVALPHDYPGSWGGLSTVTMVTTGLWVALPSWDDLLLSDAVMIGGPGTGGNDGHVMHFEAWLNNDPNDSRAYIWEQAGGGNGPRRRLVDLAGAAGQGYLPYRCAFVSDAGEPGPGPIPPAAELRRGWPGYMPTNEWFGNIAGPNASHGGYYARERDDVAAIQSRLLDLGYIEVGSVDGVFGPKTQAGVTRWQAEHYASTTSFYGQVWSDDWSNLFTY